MSNRRKRRGQLEGPGPAALVARLLAALGAAARHFSRTRRLIAEWERRGLV